MVGKLRGELVGIGWVEADDHSSLDIWRSVDGEHAPVMVFIHGG